MGKLKLSVLLVAAVLLVASCAPRNTTPSHTIAYFEVARAVEASATLDGEPIEVTKSGAMWLIETDAFSFAITFTPSNIKYYPEYGKVASRSGVKQFEFSIKNKLPEQMKIIWAESSIITRDGSAKTIMHAGQKFADATTPTQPTVIPPEARIDELALPGENVEWVSGSWITYPMFSRMHKGESTSLYLVLEYGGKKHALLFKLTALTDIPFGKLEE